MRAVIHTNPAIEWQVKYGAALVEGLKAVDVDAYQSTQKRCKEELTVVLGPTWCRQYHQTGKVLYLDRAFWGDPAAVSVHWLIDGQKHYDWTPRPGRQIPYLYPMRTGGKTLVLYDYGKTYNVPGTVRHHPANAGNQPSLTEHLAAHGKAIGGRSTALVEAAINGLVVDTLETNTPIDPIAGKQHPDRESWLKALSWHNWYFLEIQKGLLWKHYLKLKP